jgi:hypothetical protein
MKTITVTTSTPGELKPGEMVQLNQKPPFVARLLRALWGNPWKPEIGVVHEVRGTVAIVKVPR